MLKQTVLETCRYLLMPIVRLLLKHGVTWKEFSELAKEPYVAVARADYGIQGRPTNNSRVAMLTGLSRREVSRVRDLLNSGEQHGEVEQGNRITRILTGWHLDPEFTNDGHPKDLPVDGPTGSLASLFKKYAGDLPHGAIRKELQQRGLAKEMDGDRMRVLRRDYVLSQVDPDIVRQMGVAIHDHAATLEHNLDAERSDAARFEAMAHNQRISAKAYVAFRKLVESEGLGFLEKIDGWLTDNELDEDDADSRTVRLGVGVYLIYDESEKDE